MHKQNKQRKGFTIVELLIVIVVIGILATIAVIAYRGISANATETGMKTDLTQAGRALTRYRSTQDSYPDQLASTGTAFDSVSYAVSSDHLSYCISATSGSKSFAATNTDTAPKLGTCSGTSFVANGTPPAQGTALILTFDTTMSGCTASPAFYLSGVGAGTTIDWGDGTASATAVTGRNMHAYSTPGAYQVIVQGTYTGYGSSSQASSQARCLKSVDSWDMGSGITSLASAFRFASNLESVVTPPSTVTNMMSMFVGATKFNQDISGWNVSNVTNMREMFSGANAFNQPIGSWNVGNVVNMYGMFWSTPAFNQNIGAWDVSKVTTMAFMFQGATAFNNGGSNTIGSWNVGNVTSMNEMFRSATSFNQPLGSWDVSKVTQMGYMFYGTPFNQPIGSWNVSSVGSMSSMFQTNTAFNQPIGSWDTSNVANFSQMFSFASSFNQPIASWNTSSAVYMTYMFVNATSFNQPIGSWNVQNVSDMNYMFYGASALSANLSGWTTKAGVTHSDFRTGNSLLVEPTWN